MVGVAHLVAVEAASVVVVTPPEVVVTVVAIEAVEDEGILLIKEHIGTLRGVVYLIMRLHGP